MYRDRARSDNPPHVFAVADSAYHAMLHQRKSQCVVISGESGAGNEWIYLLSISYKFLFCNRQNSHS